MRYGYPALVYAMLLAQCFFLFIRKEGRFRTSATKSSTGAGTKEMINFVVQTTEVVVLGSNSLKTDYRYLGPPINTCNNAPKK